MSRLSLHSPHWAAMVCSCLLMKCLGFSFKLVATCSRRLGIVVLGAQLWFKDVFSPRGPLEVLLGALEPCLCPPLLLSPGSRPTRTTTGTQESDSSLSINVSHLLIALVIPSNLILITWIIVCYFSVSLLTIDFCLFLVVGIKPGPHACLASVLPLSDLSSPHFHLVFKKFIFSLNNIIKAWTCCTY